MIKNVYSINGDLDNQSEVNDVTLRENIELKKSSTYLFLKISVTLIQKHQVLLKVNQSLAKKGFSGLKITV